jgi:hypothetical protein
MDVAGPLLSFAVLAAPYLAARAVWRVRMPLSVRLIVFLAPPAALAWWLANSGRGSLTDITNPGAALIVGVMLFGWVSGATRPFRRRLIARAGGEAGS